MCILIRCAVGRLQRRISILDQHLHIFIEPSASDGCALKTTATVALTTRFDPHKAVDVGVVGCGAWQRTEASRADVAPVTPLLPRAWQSHTALIDDKLAGQALSLKVRGQCGCVVRFVP